MVNTCLALKTLFQGLIKWKGLKEEKLEIEQGTVINIWVPSNTKNKKKKDKPAVLLLHGFAGDGILTWIFQAMSLADKHAVYLPDLLFFGDSTTASTDRSPAFQADCLAKSLEKLGVLQCTVVGFSYGGVVAVKMAELHPSLISALVLSSASVMTESSVHNMLQKLGFSSLAELLLPNTMEAAIHLFSVATYKPLLVPDRFYKDYVKVVFSHRKERAELLAAMIDIKDDVFTTQLLQPILLIWGENDELVELEFVKNMQNSVFQVAICVCRLSFSTSQRSHNTYLQSVNAATSTSFAANQCAASTNLRDQLVYHFCSSPAISSLSKLRAHPLFSLRGRVGIYLEF